MSRWTDTEIPDQSGRIAVVTGANTGLGYETAQALAEHGATVVLACRNTDKAKDAADRIRRLVPEATIDVAELDLGALESVRDTGAAIRDRYDRIDLLINNAGVTGLTGITADGFEIQWGINHLGHFALTGLLLDRSSQRRPDVSSRSAASAIGSAASTPTTRPHRPEMPTPNRNSPTCSSPMNSTAASPTHRPSPRPRIPVARAPRSSATPPQASGCRISLSPACSAALPPWVRCPPSAPPRTRTSKAANITAPQGYSRFRAIPCGSNPAHGRAMSGGRGGSGTCPRN